MVCGESSARLIVRLISRFRRVRTEERVMDEVVGDGIEVPADAEGVERDPADPRRPGRAPARPRTAPSPARAGPRASSAGRASQALVLKIERVGRVGMVFEVSVVLERRHSAEIRHRLSAARFSAGSPGAVVRSQHGDAERDHHHAGDPRGVQPLVEQDHRGGQRAHIDDRGHREGAAEVDVLQDRHPDQEAREIEREAQQHDRRRQRLGDEVRQAGAVVQRRAGVFERHLGRGLDGDEQRSSRRWPRSATRRLEGRISQGSPPPGRRPASPAPRPASAARRGRSPRNSRPVSTAPT